MDEGLIDLATQLLVDLLEEVRELCLLHIFFPLNSHPHSISLLSILLIDIQFPVN